MSAKTSAQPGRRTPLSLSGATQKQQQQQQQQQAQKLAAASNEKSSNSKSENRTNVGNQKTEQIAQEKDNKKQQNVERSKQQQNAKPNAAQVTTGSSKKSEPVSSGSSNKSEKQEEKKAQNGVGNSNGNAKEKTPNGKEVVNTNQTAKEKKVVEKAEKPSVTVDKKEKVDKEIEPKVQEKKEVVEKKAEKEANVKRNADTVEKKATEKVANSEPMDVCASEEKPSAPSTPTPTKKKTATKDATPVNQQNVVENSSSSTPTKAVEPTSSPRKVTVTTTVDDVEMEPLSVEPSPKKPSVAGGESSAAAPAMPTATSTPGKLFRPKSEVKLPVLTGGSSPDRKSCPRTFSQISGRRGIRPVTEYTPSQFQSNLQFRESYRRINTELDVTSTTNTSLNVTVGSEVPNNSSFSFFGRGRKRDRTPPNSQSAMELQGDLDISPKSPKRARIDMQGFFSAVSSPLSLLRSRFSKTSIQSSTPVKLRSKLSAEDEGEVQNVSGISIEEEMHNGTGGEEATATEDVTVGNEAAEVTPKKTSADKSENMATDVDAAALDDVKQTVDLDKCGAEKSVEGLEENNDDIKVTETLNKGSAAVGGDPLAKNKRCSVM